IIRSRVVNRASALVDRRIAATVHAAIVQLTVAGRSSGEAQQPVRDLDQIRTFLTGTGPIAVVDLPWMPVFLAICFLLHPLLGLTACVGAVILFALAVLTERASRTLSRALGQHASQRQAMVEADRRNSESIVAMGM